jgi:FkbM family methyltransferase
VEAIVKGARAARGLAARARATAARLSPRALHDRSNYRRIQRRLAGPRLVAAFADAYPDAFFIEIGSNDGDQHDFLRPGILAKRWRGLMVEPVPYVFERLRANYRGLERVTLENAAIADHDGKIPFYHLREAAPGEGLPGWYHGVGSFSREAVLGHRGFIPDVEERLVEASVPCLTFESLCGKHLVEQLDLLLIDVEGYDAEIVRTIDLTRRHPRLLVYEHYHLSEADRHECVRIVEAAGYETLAEGFDTWCLDPAAAPELAELWRGLSPAVAPATAAQDRARPVA